MNELNQWHVYLQNQKAHSECFCDIYKVLLKQPHLVNSERFATEDKKADVVPTNDLANPNL